METVLGLGLLRELNPNHELGESSSCMCDKILLLNTGIAHYQQLSKRGKNDFSKNLG